MAARLNQFRILYLFIFLGVFFRIIYLLIMQSTPVCRLVLLASTCCEIFHPKAMCSTSIPTNTHFNKTVDTIPRQVFKFNSIETTDTQ